MIGTRLYYSWKGMKGRCNNSNHSDYHNYGERGIKVCEEWYDFIPFMEWAFANGYREDLTLDRKDNNGNYCPENCRWATQLEQGKNKRNNVWITIEEQTHTLEEWSKISGIRKALIAKRYYKQGKIGNKLIEKVII